MSKIYLEKVPLEEAKEKYLKLFSDYSLDMEEIDIRNARGRVTAKAVYARRSAPHYYASAMDGIAVRADDTDGASERSPLSLKKNEDAVRVDTGDPIPDEFNAVIKSEEINEKDNVYLIEKGVSPWQHIRSIGESVIKGQLILPVNHEIRSFDIGVLLEAGITRILIKKRPEIGIIPTGTEIVPPEKKPEKGELVDFNSSMMKAYGEEWGADVHIADILEDDYDKIKYKIIKENKESDILIIIAGSSAGREDYTVRILEELGEVIVHGVNIMPGKPVILAKVNDKPVIGIPGYPLAALLNYNIFVRSLVYKMLGLDLPQIPTAEAIVKRKLPSQIGLEEFIRVNLALIDDEYIAVPRKRGSAAMESLLHADGIMSIPEKKEGLSPGEKGKVYILKEKSIIKKNILFTGSHDLSLDVLVNELKVNKTGFDFNIQSVGSMAGLMALKRNECHLAGAHLLDAGTGTYNKVFVERILPGRKFAILNLVYRQQGLMVKKGNPFNLNKIEDLSREGLIFINRQSGAGTRVLLDYWLKKKDISSDTISGYEREEFTHIAAAAAVANGSADVALGIKAAAEAMDLDFIPLLEEKYDLIIPYKLMEDKRIKMIIDIINSKIFKEKVKALGGYRTDHSGELIIAGEENIDEG